MSHPHPIANVASIRGRLGLLQWLLSERLTHKIAAWDGRRSPVLFVAEHPRSGGTWLAHMISDYFQVPFPKYSRMPVRCAAVVHTHLKYSKRLRSPVFVCRDGRDLVVSAYYYTVRRIRETGARRYLKRYPILTGADGTVEDAKERMPEFIRAWARRPIGCRRNWGQYTASWLTDPDNTIVTSYESLRTDCPNEFSRIVQHISGTEAHPERLKSTIDKFSFQAQTGRTPGDDDPSDNKRKGIVGDWRTHFTAESALVFDKLMGRFLIRFGYEADRSWIEERAL